MNLKRSPLTSLNRLTLWTVRCSGPPPTDCFYRNYTRAAAGIFVITSKQMSWNTIRGGHIVAVANWQYCWTDSHISICSRSLTLSFGQSQDFQCCTAFQNFLHSLDLKVTVWCTYLKWNRWLKMSQSWPHPNVQISMYTAITITGLFFILNLDRPHLNIWSECLFAHLLKLSTEKSIHINVWNI